MENDVYFLTTFLTSMKVAPLKTKPSIFSEMPHEIINLLKSWGEPTFRAKQLVDWIFEKRVYRLENMSNIPKKLKEKLEAHFDWQLPEVTSQIESSDGATKLLLKGSHNQFIEAVILRYDNRTSLCVSSQVGCKLSCSFCQTGKLGFFRNLSAAEIVAQFCLANEMLKSEERRITHIVFMGMGEPLDNFDNVVKAVNIFTDPEANGLSARKVTVSTSGIVPKITELAKQTRCALAISLHACRDDLRSELMPINRKYNLEKLKTALLQYQKTTGEKITFEYILLKDKNCSRREAKDLVRFIHGFKAKVNLIPFNSHPGLEYQMPSDSEVKEFQSYLTDRSIAAPVRYSKGLEASAACGQLAAKQYENLNEAPKRTNALQSIKPKETLSVSE